MRKFVIIENDVVVFEADNPVSVLLFDSIGDIEGKEDAVRLGYQCWLKAKFELDLCGFADFLTENYSEIKDCTPHDSLIEYIYSENYKG